MLITLLSLHFIHSYQQSLHFIVPYTAVFTDTLFSQIKRTLAAPKECVATCGAIKDLLEESQSNT